MNENQKKSIFMRNQGRAAILSIGLAAGSFLGGVVSAQEKMSIHPEFHGVWALRAAQRMAQAFSLRMG